MVDPGWKPAVRYVPRGFVPYILIRTTTTVPRILTMRASFLASLAAVGFVIVVVPTFAGGKGGLSSSVWAAGVAGVGIYSVVVTRFVVGRKSLGAIPVDQIGAQYMQLYFLRTAFAMSVVLVGFVGVVSSGAPWLMAVGLLFGLPLLWRAAPTAHRIVADDQRRRAQGGDGSLSDALFNARPA